MLGNTFFDSLIFENLAYFFPILFDLADFGGEVSGRYLVHLYCSVKHELTHLVMQHVNFVKNNPDLPQFVK